MPEKQYESRENFKTYVIIKLRRQESHYSAFEANFKRVSKLWFRLTNSIT